RSPQSSGHGDLHSIAGWPESHFALHPARDVDNQPIFQGLFERVFARHLWKAELREVDGRVVVFLDSHGGYPSIWPTRLTERVVLPRADDPNRREFSRLLSRRLLRSAATGLPSWMRNKATLQR